MAELTRRAEDAETQLDANFHRLQAGLAKATKLDRENAELLASLEEQRKKAEGALLALEE